MQGESASLLRGINFRMLFFFGVLVFLIGYPVYIYVDSAFHAGIKDAGNGYKEVDLKAMSVFPFDQVNGTIDQVPIKWQQLDGNKIIAVGEMWQATSAERSINSFDLVYSISKCCFQGPPQVQHFVHARAARGADLEYFPNQVRVTGTLHLKIVLDRDKVTGVYSMDVDSVEPDATAIPWTALFCCLIGFPMMYVIVRRVVSMRRLEQAVATQPCSASSAR